MKTVLFLIFFSSAMATACPNLSGAWQCQDNEGKSSTLSIRQRDIPKGVLYYFTDSKESWKIYANGVLHDRSEGDTVDTDITTCNGDDSIFSRGERYHQSGGWGASFEATYTRKNSKEMQINQKEFIIVNAPPYLVREATILCHL